ncbi:Protein N-terminal glutamine amidohydrolase [Entomophthora muscae]|uniref:Protein N-terminal glutamine amidohydrolase n=1 Tax=Entomophthora muscae TaxID=34485 RepID=A0ACC2SCS0_9FUNG|nr:Protein N-terminal glutamine amidohydrolase [Entomophthora muscae]
MDPERIRSRLEDLTEVLKSSLTRERFLYSSCYCEENVYQAINELKTNENFKTYSLVRDGLLEMHTIFIINPIKAVPIWKQNVRSSEDAPVIWDYYVILSLCLMKSFDAHWILDFDTSLPLITPFEDYCTSSFRPLAAEYQEYSRYYRVVEADLYIENFASDRSHMRTKDGGWLSTPPNYPLIWPKRGKIYNFSLKFLRYQNEFDEIQYL